MGNWVQWVEIIDSQYGVEVLAELCGEPLQKNGQRVRLFDDSTTSSETFYWGDNNCQPHIYDHKTEHYWSPITAYSEAHNLTRNEAISELAERFNVTTQASSSGKKRTSEFKVKERVTPVQPDLIPPHVLGYITENKNHYNRNGLAIYLRRLFGESIACWVLNRYQIGTSKRWKYGLNTLSTALPLIDRYGGIRQLKIVPYDPQTGKRLKANMYREIYRFNGKYYPDTQPGDPICNFGKHLIGKSNPVLIPCFFGEHLLGLEPDKVIGICEAELTALVMAILDPDRIWLATGGKNGCKWHEDPFVYSVLEGRDVEFYPDNDAYVDWEAKVNALRELAITRSVKVNRWLYEQVIGPTDKRDLRDVLIKTDESGFAIDDYGYPYFWNVPNDIWVAGKRLAQTGMLSPRPAESYEIEPLPELSTLRFRQEPPVPIQASIGGVKEFTSEEMSKPEQDCIRLAEKNPALIDLIVALDLIPVM